MLVRVVPCEFIGPLLPVSFPLTLYLVSLTLVGLCCAQLFALLDMHGQVQQVVPALDVALASRVLREARATDDAGARVSADEELQVRSPLVQTTVREYQSLLVLVARAAAALFGEYEDVVARDASKILPPDGTIHPLTAQVLSYVKVRGPQDGHGLRICARIVACPGSQAATP